MVLEMFISTKSFVLEYIYPWTIRSISWNKFILVFSGLYWALLKLDEIRVIDLRKAHI